MMEELKNSEPVLTLNPFEEIREEPQAPPLLHQKDIMSTPVPHFLTPP